MPLGGLLEASWGPLGSLKDSSAASEQDMIASNIVLPRFESSQPASLAMEGRCRVCVARGVDGPAMPGGFLCEAHLHAPAPGLAAPALDPAAEEEDDTMNVAQAEHSGATQGIVALQMAFAVMETPSAFAAMIEHQMLAHFELIQAARTINGHTITPRSLDTKMEFDQVLKALAYAPNAADPWSNPWTGTFGGT